MANLGNIIQNNALAALSRTAPPRVMQAIKQASVRTGADFAYLVKQAAAESSFNAKAEAKTSSASGLYQFIESTWLSVVDKYGSKHGIETEGKTCSEILDLRKDPKAASLMAAEFAGENEKFLDAHWGGEIGSTELYFAHFLGAGQAAAFLKARDESPLQPAADLFPKAAKANRNVFYEPATGRAKTLEEVYRFFDGKFSGKQDTIRIASKASALERPAKRAPSPTFDHIELNIANSRDLMLEIINRPAPSDYNRLPFQRMMNNPVELMLLSQLELPISDK